MKKKNISSHEKTVFISVSSPLVLRNFFLVPGSVFLRLQKEGVRVVIFVPERAVERVRQEYESDTVVVEPIVVNWKPTFLERVYKFIATYLNLTEGAKLFATLGVRTDVPVAGGKHFLLPIKMTIAKTLGSSRVFRNSIMPCIDSVVYRKRPYKHIFEKHMPDIVFLPDFHSIQDTTVLREALRQKVKTIGSPGSWDHFPKKFEPLKLDTLLACNMRMQKEGTELQDYNKNDIVVTGTPYYDLCTRTSLFPTRNEFCVQHGFDPCKKIILFSAGGRYSPDDGDIVSIMLDAIKQKQLTKDAQILVRPYPGLFSEHKKFDTFEKESLVFVDWIKNVKLFDHSGFGWYPTLPEIVHFMSCLYHADVIVSTYSSVSVEASAFLKPIININFDGYQQRPFEQSIKRFRHLSHYKPVLEHGGAVSVNNKEEFIKTLNTFFQNPDANKKGVTKLRDTMCWKVDGKASERITNNILQMLK